MKIPDYSKYTDDQLQMAIAICKMNMNCSYSVNIKSTLASYKYYCDCVRAIRAEQKRRGK